MATFFEQITGIPENHGYDTVQQKLLANTKFVSHPRTEGQPYEKEEAQITGVEGKVFECGLFSAPSVAELHQELAFEMAQEDTKKLFGAGAPKLEGASANGKITLKNLVGESNSLHNRVEFNGAVVQAASQFNYLEMASPDGTPELGVGGYEWDKTQGPACAIACGAGTIYRNYLLNQGAEKRRGQQADTQVNAMEGIEAILMSKEAGGAGLERFPWDVQNGYIESDAQRLAPVNDLLASEPRLRDALVSALRIAVQEDAQVTNRQAPTSQKVTQTYNSAISIGYSYCNPKSAWDPIAKVVLDATYEATLLVGALNAIKHAKKQENPSIPPVLLTKVGGGVFRNHPSWIKASIFRACNVLTEKYGDLPLDVAVVHYGSVERGFEDIDQLPTSRM